MGLRSDQSYKPFTFIYNKTIYSTNHGNSISVSPIVWFHKIFNTIKTKTINTTLQPKFQRILHIQQKQKLSAFYQYHEQQNSCIICNFSYTQCQKCLSAKYTHGIHVYEGASANLHPVQQQQLDWSGSNLVHPQNKHDSSTLADHAQMSTLTRQKRCATSS